MTFDDYISLTNLVKLEIDIRTNSNILINKAFEIVQNRANKISKDYDIDCKALLTDNRDNKTYIIYSKYMVDKYNMNSSIVELKFKNITNVNPLDIETIYKDTTISNTEYNINVSKNENEILVDSGKNTL